MNFGVVGLESVPRPAPLARGLRGAHGQKTNQETELEGLPVDRNGWKIRFHRVRNIYGFRRGLSTPSFTFRCQLACPTGSTEGGQYRRARNVR